MADAGVLYFDINALNEIQVPLFDLDWKLISKAFHKQFNSNSCPYLRVDFSPESAVSFEVRNLKKIASKLVKLQE